MSRPSRRSCSCITRRAGACFECAGRIYRFSSLPGGWHSRGSGCCLAVDRASRSRVAPDGALAPWAVRRATEPDPPHATERVATEALPRSDGCRAAPCRHPDTRSNVGWRRARDEPATNAQRLRGCRSLARAAATGGAASSTPWAGHTSRARPGGAGPGAPREPTLPDVTEGVARQFLTPTQCCCSRLIDAIEPQHWRWQPR